MRPEPGLAKRRPPGTPRSAGNNLFTFALRLCNANGDAAEQHLLVP